MTRLLQRSSCICMDQTDSNIQHQIVYICSYGTCSYST